MKQIQIKNIREIPETSNLNDLAQYYNILLSTCQNVISINLAEEIVHEMFIKANKYFSQGKVLNCGYIFLIMKSIHLNMIKKDNRYDFNHNFLDAIDEEYSEDYYESIDKRIKTLDDRLSEYLSQEDITLFKYYKLTSLKTAAKFYDVKESVMKNKISKIHKTIRLHNLF